MPAKKPPVRIQQDPIVERLVKDPARPQLRLVSGYLGKSTRQGYWRVYLNVEFSEHLEVAGSDIVDVQRLDQSDESLNSGTWVWLKLDADVEHVRTEPQQAQARFLSGSIASRFLAGTAAGLFGSATIAALPRTFSVTECATCPTDDGSHTCVPAVCTLATSCLTTVPTDPGCGGKFL